MQQKLLFPYKQLQSYIYVIYVTDKLYIAIARFI